MPRKKKYGYLFDDPDIKRWYANIARGSEITADVDIRRLGRFCELQKIKLKNLIELKDKEISNLFMDFVSWSEKQGHAGSYIKASLKSVKSWLHHNNRDVKTRIKIRNSTATPTLKDERTPLKDELRKIFLAGDNKARVASVLMAHSGLRDGSLGNYKGNDGLKVNDLPELTIDGKEVFFEEIPTIINVRKELSKTKKKYLTFLGEEGCGYLKDYLEERIRKGENITKESAIITAKIQKKPFITSTNVGDAIRGAIRKAGFQWRPYVLRAYFDTQLLLAESKRLLNSNYRQHWMGHVGNIEHVYTTHKKLNPDMIEDMRESYKRSQDFLQTTGSEENSKNDIREEFRKQFLIMSGYNSDEIADMDVGAMDDEELQEKVRERLLGQSEKNSIKQRVVSIQELNSYFSEGWEFVANLPNETVILQNPF